MSATQNELAEYQPVKSTGSLYGIAADLVELVDIADDPEAQEAEREAAKTQIQAHVGALTDKAERIRALVRFCEMEATAAEQEATRAATVSRRLAKRVQDVKAMVLGVMQLLNVRKLKAGATGSFTVQMNGGVLPVDIVQPELVPDEYCRMVGFIYVDRWKFLLEEAGYGPGWTFDQGFKLERVPQAELIRKALESPCETCAGLGQIAVATEENTKEASPCGACGGDGKTKVPGARLGLRGEHLRVR